MPNFPPLMPAPSTDLGDVLSAAAQAHNGHLAAKNQQIQLQRQQQRDQVAADHQDLMERLDAYGKGGVPADIVEPGPNGMKTRRDNPAVTDPSRVITTTGGSRIYIPKDSEQGKTFVPTGQLGQALQGMGWDGKTPITPEHTHSLMQALNEAQPKDEPFDIDTSGKFLDKDGKPQAVLVGKKSGTVRPIAMPEGSAFALPEKAEKPDQTQVDLEHFSSPIQVNKTTGEITPLKLPDGVKPQLTVGQQATADRSRERQQDREDARSTREEDRQQKGRDDAQKQIDIFNTAETEQHEKRSAYGQILSQPNSKSKESKSQRVTVIDPDSKQDVEMTPARRAYYQGKYDKATALAGTYNQQAQKLITRHGGDTGGAQPAGPSPNKTGTVDAKTANKTAGPATQLPTGHKVGDTVNLKSGKTVKITKIYGDGTFDY